MGSLRLNLDVCTMLRGQLKTSLEAGDTPALMRTLTELEGAEAKGKLKAIADSKLGQVVKKLTSFADDEVSSLAARITEKWKRAMKEKKSAPTVEAAAPMEVDSAAAAAPPRVAQPEAAPPTTADAAASAPAAGAPIIRLSFVGPSAHPPASAATLRSKYGRAVDFGRHPIPRRRTEGVLKVFCVEDFDDRGDIFPDSDDDEGSAWMGKVRRWTEFAEFVATNSKSEDAKKARRL